MTFKIIKFSFPFLFIFFANQLYALLFGQIAGDLKITFDINLLICICVILIRLLKNRFNKLLISLWVVFFYLGILNIIASVKRGEYAVMDIHDGTVYFFVNILVFALCLLLVENLRLNLNKKAQKLTSSFNDFKNSFVTIFLIVFPLLFGLSIYNHVGTFPLFSGRDIIDKMYELDYGPLYGYKYLCVYSFLILIFFLKMMKNRWLVYLYLALFLIIILLDGKRVVAIVCLLAYIPFNITIDSILNKENFENRFLQVRNYLIFGFLGIVYVLTAAIREGTQNKANFLTNAVEKVPFGVEYRDFIYSFDNYPRSMPGYSYESSAVGSFFNSYILKTLGYSKNHLVQTGSAYSWMRYEGIDLGIRTGFISELFFAYGYWGILCIISFALFTAIITRTLTNSTSLIPLIHCSIMYAFVVLLIMGQSTEFFGSLTIVLYVWLAYKIVNPKTNYDLYSDSSTQ